MVEVLVCSNNVVIQEVVDCLNDVYICVGLVVYQLSDFILLDDFFGVVFKECGYELWGEGCCCSDLICYGLYIDYVIKYKGLIIVKEYMNLMFLLQSVIMESSGQVIQNEGY